MNQQGERGGGERLDELVGVFKSEPIFVGESGGVAKLGGDVSNDGVVPCK